jgi:hypothetical protein
MRNVYAFDDIRNINQGSFTTMLVTLPDLFPNSRWIDALSTAEQATPDGQEEKTNAVTGTSDIEFGRS